MPWSEFRLQVYTGGRIGGYTWQVSGDVEINMEAKTCISQWEMYVYVYIYVLVCTYSSYTQTYVYIYIYAQTHVYAYIQACRKVLTSLWESSRPRILVVQDSGPLRYLDSRSMPGSPKYVQQVPFRLFSAVVGSYLVSNPIFGGARPDRNAAGRALSTYMPW